MYTSYGIGRCIRELTNPVWVGDKMAFLDTCLKMIAEQEIHIHNYPSDSSSSSKDSSSGDKGSSDKGSSEKSASTTADGNSTATSSTTTQNSQNNQTSQGLQKQNTQREVGKMMDRRQPQSDQKAKDKKGMKDFKEVFVRNHVRKYKRRPSIGLMKQTFGVHN